MNPHIPQEPFFLHIHGKPRRCVVDCVWGRSFIEADVAGDFDPRPFEIHGGPTGPVLCLGFVTISVHIAIPIAGRIRRVWFKNRFIVVPPNKLPWDVKAIVGGDVGRRMAPLIKSAVDSVSSDC